MWKPRAGGPGVFTRKKELGFLQRLSLRCGKRDLSLSVSVTEPAMSTITEIPAARKPEDALCEKSLHLQRRSLRMRGNAAPRP